MKFTFLPRQELKEALDAHSETRALLFIAGIFDFEDGFITFITANLDTVTVHWSVFKPSGTCIPDFSRFGLTDYGRTVVFGEYEASSDFVLSKELLNQ